MNTGNLDGQGLAELRNYNFQRLTSAPTTDVYEGRFYFNTTDHTLYVYNGSEWVDALTQGRIYLEGAGIDITDNTISIDLATGSSAGNVTLTTTNGLAANIDLSGKVDKLSTKPTAGTYTKVTINNEGQVTEGTTLSASDIPNLSLSKITDVTATASEVNILDGATVSTSELNVLDGITASTAELNYTDGVTSNIQTQLDNKLAEKPDGTNELISDNKITLGYLPDVVLGQMLYAGTFVPSTAVATLSKNAKTKLGTTSNTITLTNDTTAITGYEANEGNYYLASADGTFAGISFLTGDWLLSTGSGWTKIDNTDAVTGVKGNAESNYRIGNVNITADNVLPTQTNNSGKFLGTDGTNCSWQTVDALPSQSGNSGKLLTTNGTSPSWIQLSYSTQNPAITVSSSGIGTWTVTHNLNTTDIDVSVYEISTGNKVMYDVSISSANAVVISIISSANIAVDTYKVVIKG